MNQMNQMYDIQPDAPYERDDTPLTAQDLKDNGWNVTDEDTLQFQADVINVFEKRVNIEDFDPAYQKRLKDYYRFSAVSPGTLAGSMATKGAQRSGKG